MSINTSQKSPTSNNKRRFAKGSIRLLILLQLLLVVAVVCAFLFISRELLQEALSNMQNHLNVKMCTLDDRLIHSFNLFRFYLGFFAVLCFILCHMT